MNDRLPSVGAFLFALLLVSSATVAGPGAFTAQATHDCSTLEQTLTFAFGTTGQVVDKALRDGKCTESHRAEAIEDMKQTDANQTKLDIYNAALQQKAETDTQTAVYDNYLNDSQSVAWMKAEIAIAEAYRNGSSKAVAESKARQAIADYYAKKQVNLLKSWNVSVASIAYLAESARNESVDMSLSSQGDTSALFYIPEDSQNEGFHAEIGDTSGNVTGVNSYALVNGSQTAARTIKGHVSYNENQEIEIGLTSPGHVPAAWYYYRVKVNPTDLAPEPVTMMDLRSYMDRLDRIQTLNNDLQADVDPFVNETWEAYDSGQINSSDVLSRNTQMFEYGLDATNGSSRNLYNSVAALSAMGLDTPQLNGTGTMAVTHQNQQYHGLIMAKEAPNGRWQSNTSYNASQIPGHVMLVTTSGEQKQISGEFRIGTISAEDGGSIDQVNATKVVYKTSNTSEQLKKMERILELRKEVESREPTAGGGGSSDSSGVDPKILVGVVAIAGVGLYVAGSRD